MMINANEDELDEFIGLKGRRYKRVNGKLVRIDSFWLFGSRGRLKEKCYRGKKNKILFRKSQVFFKKIIPVLSWKKLRRNRKK